MFKFFSNFNSFLAAKSVIKNDMPQDTAESIFCRDSLPPPATEAVVGDSGAKAHAAIEPEIEALSTLSVDIQPVLTQAEEVATPSGEIQPKIVTVQPFPAKLFKGASSATADDHGSEDRSLRIDVPYIHPPSDQKREAIELIELAMREHSISKIQLELLRKNPRKNFDKAHPHIDIMRDILITMRDEGVLLSELAEIKKT